jgi:hypothetical protein
VALLHPDDTTVPSEWCVQQVDHLVANDGVPETPV